MNKLLTEAIGTFILVFTICMVSLGNFPNAPLVIGASLMIAVYMGGHVSGAHYNPAVSLALWMRGKLPSKDLVPYWVSQLIGAVVASILAWQIHARTFAPAPGEYVLAIDALFTEMTFTFILVLVVLNVACTKATEGNSYYGLAIGFTIAVGAAAGGGVSGGAYNPAVGLGPTIVNAMNGGSLGDVWLYLVGPFAGGSLGAIVYAIQHGESVTKRGD